MVTEPTAVDVVYAYTVVATPVDVTEIDDTPDATETGARVVLSAETNLTVDEAVNTTDVPVSAVAARASECAASITFVTGTATVDGAADVVVFAALATVTANGAAEDAVTERPVIARAAAVAIEIFLNEFIHFPFLIVG
jgi:hypothetical protein